jgi:hypothetical protein
VGPAQAGQRHSARKRPVKQEPAVAAPAPQPTPPPLTLEQMPASPPQVAYRNGELTIVSQNSTLGDILRAVRAQTGAAVDIPANATERVVSHLGPGPARDVLAALLNGSHFNYVMLGSASSPSALERVILTPKGGGAPEAGQTYQANAGQPVYSPPQVQQQVPAQDADEMSNEDFTEDVGDPENQPDQAEDQQQQQPANGQPAIKTPEQMLQELQRQQQLQQQQGRPPLPGQMPQPYPQQQPPQQ